jgi:hypothetical protein
MAAKHSMKVQHLLFYSRREAMQARLFELLKARTQAYILLLPSLALLLYWLSSIT